MISDDLIYLRRVSRDDLGAYHRWYSDPDIQRYLANPHWKPECSLDDYRHLFLRRHLLQTGSSMTLTICLNEDDRPVGLVHCFDIDRKECRCELGLIVGDKGLWRMGIGTSAVRLASSFLFETVGVSSICCGILTENRPSIGLFEKCGFRFTGIRLESGTRLLRYQLDRWLSPGAGANHDPSG